MTETIAIERATTTIFRFLTGKLMQSGLAGYVVGLSGGIDSSLAATLAVEAVGRDKVFGLMMPYRTSATQSLQDAKSLAERIGIGYRVIDISPMIDAYYPQITTDLRIRAGNKMARERMSILFDTAHAMQQLVLGTGNRSEICLGYTTLFGDSACSVNPIGELYKTEVRMMARLLGLPQPIIDKAPSADLWAGQTDEGEIGVTYEQIDRLLVRIIDDGVTSMELLEHEGFSTTEISRVVSLLNRNAFKRTPPEIAPLGRPAIPAHIQLQK